MSSYQRIASSTGHYLTIADTECEIGDSVFPIDLELVESLCISNRCEENFDFDSFG